LSQPGNLGQTRLRGRRRQTDPMRAYDALPPELRAWMAQAALPWSPASCLRLWRKLMAEEGCAQRVLGRLDRAERAMLEREGALAAVTAGRPA